MLTRRAGWLRRLVVGAAIIAALVVAAIAALPLFVDADRVQRAVERRISAVAGGEVRYESLALRFFPQPSAGIRNATVRIPGAVDGRIAAVDIRIALLPLLAGDVRPVAIRVDQPVLEVRIEPGGGTGDPLAAYRAALGPVVDAVTREARGMSLQVIDGKLDLVYAGRRVVSLSGLAADANVAADGLVASASAASDLWRAAKAQLKVAAGSLAATGTLAVSGMRLPEAVQAAGLQGELRVLDAAVDATLDAETDGRESVRSAITATAPDMRIARGARTLDLGAVRTALDASRDGAALTVSLRELQLGELVPAATGALRAKPDGAAPSVEVQVPALDLARLRAALMALAGDLDAVQAALAFVPTGTAQGLTADAAGGDFGALTALGAMRAQTQLVAGALELPAQGIRITGAAGRFALAGGTLRGSDLAGAIGKSTFTGGELVVELAPAAALRELDAALDADLGEALPIVRRLIGKAAPAALANVESLQGRASGTVAYDARHRPPRVTVDLARIRATGRYRGVPLPIAVNAGALHYARDRIVVRGLDGALGRSQLQGGAMELELGSEPIVRAASADAVLVLDEVYPWLASIEGLRRPMSGIPSATGTADVRLARLSGPLTTPAALDYEAVIRPQQVRFVGPVLPAPLTISGGESRVTSRTVALDRLDVSMLDARIVASGTVQDYASTEPRFDLALADGRAGELSLDWARTRWQLPGKALPRAPLTLGSGRLQRAGGAGAPLILQGTLGLAAGVRAEFDLVSQPGHLDLRRLAVKDPDTDATVSLKWTVSTAELGFSGRLDNRTLARVLAEPPTGDGALQGDFRASIDFAEPRQSSATGALEGDRIDILERWGIPVAIDRVRLDVADDAVQIREGAVAVAGERLAVTGAVTRRPKTFGIDLRVTAEAIDVERLLRAFPRGGAADPGGAWNLPVEGRVALDAKSVAYGARVFSPVAGTVSLAPGRITADVKETRLCGIGLPFNAVLVPGTATVTGRIQVRALPLAGTVSCLTGEHIAMTGTLDGNAELTASGPPDGLVRAARGSFSFSARDGRIQRAPAIARILSLDTVVALLRARPSELIASGLDYSELAVAGTLDAGHVRIENATLASSAIGMAMSGDIDIIGERLELRGLVAPFGRVESVVQRIPILGRILGTSVVGIPVSVSGDLYDPEVVPLGPAAVGQSVVNLMSAIVKTPVEIFDPLVHRLPRAP